MTDEIKDATTEIITATDDMTASDDGKDKTPTSDDGKLEKAKEDAQAKLDKILEKHGYDSAEDLEEDLNSGKTIKELLGDRDAAEIIKKAEILEKYEAYWDSQKEQQLREEEEPDTTIARLEKRAKEAEAALKNKDVELNAAKETEKLLTAYESEVSSFIKSEDIPKEYRPFVLKFMGVNNPFNEVDLKDKAAVRKIAKELLKEAKDFEQVIIKRYRQGKVDTPAMTKTDAAPATDATKKPQTMEDRGLLLKEALSKILSK